MAHTLTRHFYLTFLALAGVLSFAVPSATQANRIAEADWNEGMVILSNDEVQKGELYYDHANGVVLLRSGAHQRVKTLTVRQVRSFRYYNAQDNLVHHFLAIDHRTRSSYPIRGFYEIVSKGDVLYLRQRNGCRWAPPHHVSPHVVAYDYFAYYQGQLVRSHRFEQELLPVLAEADPTLLRYMKESRLRPYEVEDQILLVAHVNRGLPSPLADVSSRP